jgi:hypothetical protein
MYNTALTWGGLYTLWDPPHVRGVLYPYCTCDVRESHLIYIYTRGFHLIVSEGCVKVVQRGSIFIISHIYI